MTRLSRYTFGGGGLYTKLLWTFFPQRAARRFLRHALGCSTDREVYFRILRHRMETRR